ncbi:MAG TPA: hypothetical protein VFQ59_03265 [Candidatus Paceibacterota bacterium]|nr:hypothetical protein [Candidatus Paceibacterota bacterium]
MQNETRQCANCKSNFLIEAEDFSFYEKMSTPDAKIPAPTFCAKCRLIRRLRIRNERALFKVKCGMCQKNTITMYNPVAGYLVYCSSCYLSTDWDPLSYGRDYDFSRPFFEQLADLMKVVPRKAVHSVGGGINTEFSNYLVNSKESYLSYSVIGSEHIYYSRVVDNSKECLDSSNIKDCEACYETLHGTKNYRSAFLIESSNCLNSNFLYDCTNCSDCFMSANLRNKQYVFRGVEMSRDEYFKALSEINMSSYENLSKLKIEFKEMFRFSAIHRFVRIFKSDNCTGDYIENSKNVKESFEIFKAEDSKYSLRLTDGPAGLFDVVGSGKSEMVYEASGISWGTQNSAFISAGHATANSQYCDYCMNVENIFGCVSVDHVKYVILNKQYDKKSYEELRAKIIKHMNEMPYIDEAGIKYGYGEFFPQICIPHAYNHSTAQEYFPLSKNEIESKGYLWRDPEVKKYEPNYTKEGLPDSVYDLPDNFEKEVIECAHKGKCAHVCTEAFKLHPNELSYLKKWNIAIPRLCPNCRHYERIELRRPPILHDRQCVCKNENHSNHVGDCQEKFKTTHLPEDAEKVYCEQCYQREVY